MKSIKKAICHLCISFTVLVVVAGYIGYMEEQLPFEQVFLAVGMVALVTVAVHCVQLAYVIIKTIVNKCRGK